MPGDQICAMSNFGRLLLHSASLRELRSHQLSNESGSFNFITMSTASVDDAGNELFFTDNGPVPALTITLLLPITMEVPSPVVSTSPIFNSYLSFH